MVDEFQETLKANLRRRIAAGAAASLITRCIRDIFSFTPEGLEAAISDGWSLVDSLNSLPPADLQQILFSIPSMELIIMGLSKEPASSQLYAEELARDFSLSEVVDRVTQALPQHGLILAAHIDWLESEGGKFFSLLS